MSYITRGQIYICNMQLMTSFTFKIFQFKFSLQGDKNLGLTKILVVHLNGCFAGCRACCWLNGSWTVIWGTRVRVSGLTCIFYFIFFFTYLKVFKKCLKF